MPFPSCYMCREMENVSSAFRVGPGSGLTLPKCFGPTSGLHTKLFYNIQIHNFFLSWRMFVVLTAVNSVSEVIVIFLRLILFANTTTFVCSLLGSVSRTVFEKVTAARKLEQGWPCFEKINHLPVFHAHYIAIPNSFFYAYCAIVGIFVLVKFFLEKHYILQHYR